MMLIKCLTSLLNKIRGNIQGNLCKDDGFKITLLTLFNFLYVTDLFMYISLIKPSHFFNLPTTVSILEWYELQLSNLIQLKAFILFYFILFILFILFIYFIYLFYFIYFIYFILLFILFILFHKQNIPNNRSKWIANVFSCWLYKIITASQSSIACCFKGILWLGKQQRKTFCSNMQSGF